MPDVSSLSDIKTEFIRKLSKFNFQWTKTLYQNNLKLLHSFLHFSRAIDVITPKKISYESPKKNECQISQNDILHMTFLEFYLCFHNSCEI